MKHLLTSDIGECRLGSGLVASGIHAMAVFLIVFAMAMPAVAGTLVVQDEEGKLTGGFVALEGHVSLFTDAAEKSMLAGTFGYGLRGGYRWNSIGLFLHVEHNMWLATEYETDLTFGAVNIGVGIDYIYAGGLVHSGLAIGPSILAQDTELDEAGSTGLFIDARPVGLRWAVNDRFVVGLDPITFAVVAPVLGSIPLVQLEYRTELYLEIVF